MGVDAQIQAALYGHLKALNLPTALPIAPEGKDFDAKGKAYLRATYMPAETTGPQLSDEGDEARGGLFQIDVFWPAGEGIAKPLAVADAIQKHFHRGVRFFLEGVDLRLIEPAYALPAQQEPTLLQIPVRVRWWAAVEFSAA